MSLHLPLAMAESPILDPVDALVVEGHGLWAESEQRRLDEAGHEPPQRGHGVHTDEPAPDRGVPRDVP